MAYELIIKAPFAREELCSIEIPHEISGNPNSRQVLLEVKESMEGFTCEIAASNLNDILVWLEGLVFERKHCTCQLNEWKVLFENLERFLFDLEENNNCVVVEKFNFLYDEKTFNDHEDKMCML